MSYSAHMNTPDIALTEPDIPPVDPKKVPNVGRTERIVTGIVGGSLLAVAAVRRRSAGDAVLGTVGALLLARAVSGHCPTYAALRTGTNHNATIGHGQGIKIEHSVTIEKPSDELYTYWRNFANLPVFMRHLESVEVIDGKKSHWTSKAPLGKTVSWDAEIIAEEPGKRIAWRSTDDADIANAGSVRFKPVPGNRGTQVTVSLEYAPPLGVLGALAAKIGGEEPNKQVKEDLRRFKQIMETGEIATNGGLPPGQNTVGDKDSPTDSASLSMSEIDPANAI